MATAGRCAALFSSVFARNLTLERSVVNARSFSLLQSANYNKPWPNSYTALRKYHKSRTVFGQSKVKNEKKIKLLKLPASDDVYREDLYESQTYDLTEAITTMKRYMELDFAPRKSLVWITLGLHPAPVKKGRQRIYTVLDLPHEFDYTNRICVLTDDVDQIKAVLNDGALLAGGDEVIQQLILRKIECDGFVCDPAYSKNKIMGNKELMNVMKTLKPRRGFGLNDDVIHEFLRLKDETLITNSTDETVSEVIVGRIHQSVNELEENISAVIEEVQKLQNPKHPPIVESASISCCEETLNFTIVNDD